MFNNSLLFKKVSLGMLRLLVLLLLTTFSVTCCFAQSGYLFIKKGAKKKRTYTEGDMIRLKLTDGSLASGTITLLRNDTIFLNGHPIPVGWVSEVLLKRKAKRPFPDGK